MARHAPAPADDLDRIMAVMACAFDANFNEAWTRAQLADALLIGNCHYRLIAPDGTIPNEGEPVAGFALMRDALDEQELLLLAVAPAHRRQGLGAQLLAWIKADAQARGIRRILLEMRQGNRAEALYGAHGFRRIGLRPNYYRDSRGQSVDAITFCCALDAAPIH